MPTETLICQFDGHHFQRERKRGVKPKLCPEHAGAILRPANSNSSQGEGIHQEVIGNASGALTAAHSYVSDEALDLLTRDGGLEEEFKRKLTFVVECLDDPCWIGRREEEDVKLMRERQDSLLREAKRGGLVFG